MSDNDPVVGVLIGVLMVGVGLIYITNFKGLASWHARASLLTARPLRSVPPWSWLPQRTLEQDLAVARRIQRSTGAVLLILGLLVVGSSLGELL